MKAHALKIADGVYWTGVLTGISGTTTDIHLAELHI